MPGEVAVPISKPLLQEFVFHNFHFFSCSVSSAGDGRGDYFFCEHVAFAVAFARLSFTVFLRFLRFLLLCKQDIVMHTKHKQNRCSKAMIKRAEAANPASSASMFHLDPVEIELITQLVGRFGCCCFLWKNTTNVCRLSAFESQSNSSRQSTTTI